MTYATGQIAQAADFNTFLTTVKRVYGTGSGDYGYGQTAIAQETVTSADTITAQQWTNLRNMIVKCAAHQGTDMSTLMVQPSATSLLTPSMTLAQNIGAIEVNRLQYATDARTLTTGVHTVTAANAWTGTISAVVDVNFGSENAARFFFNSGGAIRVRMSQPGTSTVATHWNTLFSSRMGTVSLLATSTITTGTAGVPMNHGYYGLSGSGENLYDGTNIGSAYAYSYADQNVNNDVFIQVQALNNLGYLGGNGSGIRFTVTLHDDYALVGNPVPAGTQLAFDVNRATTYLDAIPIPSFTTVTSFS